MTAEVQAFPKHGVIIPELSTRRCHLILSPATCLPDPSWTMSLPILSHVWNGPSLSLLVLGRGSSFEFIYSLNPSVHLHFVTHRNDRVFFFFFLNVLLVIETSTFQAILVEAWWRIHPGNSSFYFQMALSWRTADGDWRVGMCALGCPDSLKESADLDPMIL